MDGWMGGWVDGWMDGWVHNNLYSLNNTKSKFTHDMMGDQLWLFVCNLLLATNQGEEEFGEGKKERKKGRAHAREKSDEYPSDGTKAS
jgi:hypothetical protein